MQMKRIAMTALLCGASVANAGLIIQPDESASADTFVYKFLGNTPIGSGGAFGGFLASGRAGGGQHDLRSFLKFDTSSVDVAAVQSVTLNLYVISSSGVGFGADPTPALPVTTDVFPVTATWAEASTTWNNQPAIGASNIGSASISGIDRWVSIDVTGGFASAVEGFALVQRDFVGGPSQATSVVGVYQSASAANKPFLEVTYVPEPAGLTAAVGLAMLAARRRRSA
jgi:hypothetical protein